MNPDLIVIRELVDYIDTLKKNIGHIEDAIEEIRDQDFDIENVQKDNRYSVQVLLTEHKRLTSILENVLDTVIVSEELKSKIVKI